MKKFNVTGLCVPEEHYMVNTEDKLNRIMKLINDKQYFTINRARQYGKTTTLFLLERVLTSSSEYTCLSLSFEGVGGVMFESDKNFCREFLIQASEALRLNGYGFAGEWIDGSVSDFAQLSRHISKLCADKKIVLMIDEVDATSKNSVFLRFLGMLRNLYLQRPRGKVNTFHSVILAGVHDIKNIKLKLITSGSHTLQPQEGELNSPWNIAADFNVNLSFSPSEIATMLTDYEADHQTNMDIPAVSEEIFRFTGGYPYLVSRICQCVDKEMNPKEWTVGGIQSAVKAITNERSVLYDDMFKNLENNKAIYDFMYSLLIVGDKKRLSIFDPIVERCSMYGFITVDSQGRISVSNKVFEMIMTDYFISKENSASNVALQVCGGMYKEITGNSKFDMELCLRKFAEHYEETCASSNLSFLETHGRLIFLSFLKPLVNGHGFFHIESQFTDLRRMDVVVDFGREQFIIELKLWKGEQAQSKAYEQLLDYMDSKRLDKGYLLTFDFRKEGNKERKAEWVQVAGKQIFEVIV